jgi:hypothetical protein
VALFSITIAASLFAMPVIYHHLEYPYTNLEKFKARSHRFTIFGLIHSGITLYLGIEIALGSVLNTIMAFALAAHCRICIAIERGGSLTSSSILVYQLAAIRVSACSPRLLEVHLLNGALTCGTLI